MDLRLINQLKDVRHDTSEELADSLLETIIGMGGAPMTVTNARNKLSSVLDRVRDGVPQMVGKHSKGEMAVIISFKDLTALLGEARRKETLAEGLASSGFVPYRGAPVVVGQGRRREPLTIHPAKARTAAG